jgi:hypothetical protein
MQPECPQNGSNAGLPYAEAEQLAPSDIYRQTPGTSRTDTSSRPAQVKVGLVSGPQSRCPTLRAHYDNRDINPSRDGAADTPMLRSVRADRAERSRALPGDDLVAHPIASLTHAVAIRRPPRDVWSWLVQMGAGRAGWYSYDLVDNGGRHSVERIVPELQHIDIGAIMPAAPGVTDGFTVLRFAREHHLILGWLPPSGGRRSRHGRSSSRSHDVNGPGL